jgi:hypothetical protein
MKAGSHRMDGGEMLSNEFPAFVGFSTLLRALIFFGLDRPYLLD